MIKLTYKQVWWLNSRGGRNTSDVQEDNEGLFCWFGGGGKALKRVPLPKDKDIDIRDNLLDN